MTKSKILMYLLATIFSIGFLVGCTENKGGDNMKLESDAFSNNGFIPKKYTCQGDDINPRLEWSSVPEETKSFALIVEDPDAPSETWIHWAIKNIDKNIRKINENSTTGEEIINSFGKKNYGGPCPPSGTHRYYFKLYALDTEKLEANKIDELKEEIEEHVIEEAVLMGRYAKE
ncbi:MAG: hypothetical protein PWQ87_705 [Candidatus Woesearchaeota archaeon]|nr:hypothetical protein [Candidatus Woesearchaeota archaeon]